MSLNIKNEEAHRLVQELSDLDWRKHDGCGNSGRTRETGSGEHCGGMVERIREDQKRVCRPLWKEGRFGPDHAELLYDEDGLPK